MRLAEPVVRLRLRLVAARGAYKRKWRRVLLLRLRRAMTDRKLEKVRQGYGITRKCK